VFVNSRCLGYITADQRRGTEIKWQSECQNIWHYS
jgi:hypothetical protein